MPGRVHRLRGLLAGRDGPGRRALPAGELLHPSTLALVALLVVNDWWLKPHAVLPAVVTGKLSDVAGLGFFPLFATAATDVLLLCLWRLGLGVDFTLRRWKLGLALGLTAAGFAAVKLSPAAAGLVAGALRSLGLDARIVADPSDLMALPALVLPLVVGWREIARVPLGRLELIARGRRPAAVELADVVACGGERAEVAELAAALADGHRAAQVARSLAKLRGET